MTVDLSSSECRSATQVDHVVDQVGTQEEFGGEVTDGPGAGGLVGLGGLEPTFQQTVAHCEGRGHVEVVGGGHLPEPSLHVEQVVDIGVLQGFLRQPGSGVLAGWGREARTIAGGGQGTPVGARIASGGTRNSAVERPVK